MEEEWRPIPEWEGVYEASSQGRIRSVPRMVWHSAYGGYMTPKPGKVLTQRMIRRGYMLVVLSKLSKDIPKNVAPLVCAAFHGPRPFPKAHACHMDGVPHNNTPQNLQWGSAKFNASHKIAHGTDNGGEKHYRSKLTDLAVREIRCSAGTNSDLAKKFGVAYGTIQQVRSGRGWSHIPMDSD